LKWILASISIEPLSWDGDVNIVDSTIKTEFNEDLKQLLAQLKLEKDSTHTRINLLTNEKDSYYAKMIQLAEDIELTRSQLKQEKEINTITSERLSSITENFEKEKAVKQNFITEIENLNLQIREMDMLSLKETDKFKLQIKLEKESTKQREKNLTVEIENLNLKLNDNRLLKTDIDKLKSQLNEERREHEITKRNLEIAKLKVDLKDANAEHEITKHKLEIEELKHKLRDEKDNLESVKRKYDDIDYKLEQFTNKKVCLPPTQREEENTFFFL